MPSHKNKFMLRRAAAISFLFLANIILLAVAVVPHHHHEEMICFTASHCGGHEHEHDADCSHDEQQPLHTHEHHGDTNYCHIGKWLPPNIAQGHKCQCHCFCTACNNDLFVATLPDFSEPNIKQANLPFRQAPFEETYISVYVSQILGLRAPPFC